MNSRVPHLRTLRPVAIVGLATAATALTGCSVNNNGDDQIAGKQLFVQKCGSCHVLSRADTKGTVGPNLDEAFTRALKDGFGREAVRGVVYRQILHPQEGSVMPGNLVDADQAKDVAAYVALVASARGKDTGLLASAVKQAGSDKPAAAVDGVLTIPADPGGQLLYVNKTAQAPAGPLEIVLVNKSAVPHDIVIDGLGRTEQFTAGTGSFKATVKTGEYTFYCSVEGHRAAGMEGVLTVK